MTREWLEARLEKCKALVEAYEDAILALTTGGEQSYSLNTGQTSQTVTRFNLASLNVTLGSLLNMCATIEARLNGASVNLRPAW